MERDHPQKSYCRSCRYFNSHAHVERDYFDSLRKVLLGISTHTLTWSVTGSGKSRSLKNFISTHTLTWSVTYPPQDREGEKYISTHTLTWSVTVIGTAFKKAKDISTHTLTWSVTYGICKDSADWGNFNSHAHVERDRLAIQFDIAEGISTHTLTWSVTQAKGTNEKKATISTHTLTWSVTSIAKNTGLSVKFQLTRSRGA